MDRVRVAAVEPLVRTMVSVLVRPLQVEGHQKGSLRKRARSIAVGCLALHVPSYMLLSLAVQNATVT